jgi:hypothetical protein
MSAFHSVCKYVNQWQSRALSSELQYRNSLARFLREHLKAKVETEYRHEGTTADIYVEESGFLGSSEVFIEMKRNLLQKTQLDRLVGQIESLRPNKHSIVVVLCGETRPALLQRLTDKYGDSDEFLMDCGFRVIIKESAAHAVR